MTLQSADPEILQQACEALGNEIADRLLDPVSSPLRNNPELADRIEGHAKSLRLQAQLLKQDATRVSILEELERAEFQLLASRKRLDQEREVLYSFASELGKAAFDGLQANELTDYPVFADRQDLQAELEKLYREREELLAVAPESSLEKITRVADNAKLAYRIQSEEARILPTETALGKSILQADERWSFDCSFTRELLPKIDRQKRKVEAARNDLAQVEEQLANLKSESALKLERSEFDGVEINSQSIKADLKDLRKQYSGNQKELAANRRFVLYGFLQAEAVRQSPDLQRKIRELADLKEQLQQIQPRWKSLISESQNWLADWTPQKKQLVFGFCVGLLCLSLTGYALRVLFASPATPVQISHREEVDSIQPISLDSPELPREIVNSIGMKLILIPEGNFVIGSPNNEIGRAANEKQHPVTIDQNYYLGAFQVTQAQYRQVMGNNPSFFQGQQYGDTSKHPVEHVSWKDAVEFCRRLSELPEEKRAGRIYRLPTEVEWEYACRAGSNTAYSFGDDSRQLSDYAWFGNNSGRRKINARMIGDLLSDDPGKYRATLLAEGCQTHPIGLKQPNAWGLYDMHGNVWEWCHNWLDDYSIGLARRFGDEMAGSSLRVLRGGSWDFWDSGCRSASRAGSDPADSGDFYGFRVVLSTTLKAPTFASKSSADSRPSSGITVDNSIGMRLVLIPEGSFTMGSPMGELERSDREEQFQATIGQDFFLGAFEVTQSQFEKVMGKNPSNFQGSDYGDTANHPVEMVSWQDAVEFCRRLSELPEERKAGRSYRLPTEAEWEYACRSGSHTTFSFGESSRLLTGYAWFSSNSDRQTQPVGRKKPTDWGLYDMHGNVAEWCLDWSGNYPIQGSKDPVGPPTGTERIRRGGCWCDSPAICRSAARDSGIPSSPGFDTGFRVVMIKSRSSIEVAVKE